jgi:hypothetical protein
MTQHPWYTHIAIVLLALVLMSCGLQVTSSDTVTQIKSLSEALNQGEVQACGKIQVMTPYATGMVVWVRGGMAFHECLDLW